MKNVNPKIKTIFGWDENFISNKINETSKFFYQVFRIFKKYV